MKKRYMKLDLEMLTEDCPSDVDNSVTNVDNNSRIYPCDVCIISTGEYCDDYIMFYNGRMIYG